MPSAAEGIAELVGRPMTPPDPETLRAIESGPIDPSEVIGLDQLDRLLDPADRAAETGWCFRDDGSAYVAVRTPMPEVGGEMADWWFDWHQRAPERYRIWHPAAHESNSWQPPREPGSKAHWGAVHHPVEDVGMGTIRARIAFCSPTALGFSTDALDDPRVATIVCGFAGDDSRRIQHTPMAHVFMRDGGGKGDGVVLRSRFWLGAALRPYLPGPIATAGQWAINRQAVRRRALPPELPRLLAIHCAEEFANLATLLPQVYASHGPGSPNDDDDDDD